MRNDSLLKLSILSTLTGILLLYVGAVHMKAELTPISKIDKDFIGLETEISGKIIDLRRHGDGHVFLKVKDISGGTISVPIFSSTRSKLKAKIDMLDRIQVKGKVEKYEEDLEVIPSEAKDIKIVNTPPLEISKINRERLGEMVRVEGFIEDKKNLEDNSLLLNIRDGKNRITTAVSSYISTLGKFKNVSRGSKVRIAARIQPKENDLQLKIRRKEQLKILEEN